MTKRLNRLTARRVVGEKRPGRHADGGNLYLVVDKTGAKRWTFYYEFRGKQREAGLGGIKRVTLAGARAKAVKMREMLDMGDDPLGARSPAPGAPTFGECAKQLIASKRSGWRSPVHAQQWESTIAEHCLELSERRINDLGVEDVLRVLSPIWTKIPETASRLRGRLEMIFDYAMARGWRPVGSPNPTAMKGNLAHLLARRPKIAQQHLAAMNYRELPSFMEELRRKLTMAARALGFAILTAARSGEVRGARWDEIDFDAEVWTIPSERMKAGQSHRIPLSPRAMEILREIGHAGDLIFPGRFAGRPMDSECLTRLVPKGITVHGFRSSFRDWCGDSHRFPRELAEEALAHAVGNQVERSYRRGDALESRRELMCAWANFCTGAKIVVGLRAVG